MKYLCEYGCNQKANYQLKNGKWCCSLKYNSCPNSRKNNSKSLIGRKLSEQQKNAISKGNKGKHISKNTRKKISKAKIGVKRLDMNGKNNPKWKGGYSSKNIPLYNTYAHQIEYAEQIRRNKEDKNIIEVKCAYCGKWYIPKRTEIRSRLSALNGNFEHKSEYRLYCSKECKKECPVYRQRIYPKGYKKASSREVQPELRQMVFERDNWTCKKCGSTKSLQCHHVEGIRYEPLESADMDKCITYCKTCHEEVHEKEGCGYQDLKCK